ncbi:AzlC protein, partial [Hungatella hathewayi DSM 13479]
AQFIINLRYCLMSCSLSQKLDDKTPFFHRFLIGYGVTDEIFGVSVCRPGRLNPFFSYGLIGAAVPGWTLGTLLGAVSGDFLPPRILSALNVALYGMFLAVIIPPAKGNRILSGVILVSMVCSLIAAVTPVLNTISSGFKIIILTLLIAGAAAYLFPVKEPEEEQHE